MKYLSKLKKQTSSTNSKFQIPNSRAKRDGFTIIEVVLVLAIAGLIFLIVFLALPQLQRSRRDTQRKSDLNRFMASLETFVGNNGGAATFTHTTYGALRYPANYGTSTTTIEQFCDEYMYDNNGINGDHNWKDPSTGTGYECEWDHVTPLQGVVHFRFLSTCSGGKMVYDAPGSKGNQVAAMVKLEQGTYCVQNN